MEKNTGHKLSSETIMSEESVSHGIKFPHQHYRLYNAQSKSFLTYSRSKVFVRYKSFCTSLVPEIPNSKGFVI